MQTNKDLPPTPKIIYILCPDCDFDIPADKNLKQRLLDGKLAHINQVYVECPNCSAIHHQFYTTPKIIRLRQQADKLASIHQLLISRNPNLDSQVTMVATDLGISEDDARERMIAEVSKKFERARKKFDVANKGIQQSVDKALKNENRRQRRLERMAARDG